MTSNITAQIQGEISGQVAVGSRIIQIGSVHGGVVNIASAEQQPRRKAIATPVFLLPRPFEQLIGRKDEIKSAIAALESKQSVEFYSVSGLGKSVLLRYLAYHPQISAPFADGVISFTVRYQTVADLLQCFFEAFYETDIAYKPTYTEIRQALQNKQALIILDDQKLTRDDLEELINATPGCTFVLASPERHLWGEGQGMKLLGLAIPDALTLVERELQRQLTSEEQQLAETLCTVLEGHPLQLILTIATVQEEKRSLSEVVQQLQPSQQNNSLIKQILASRTKPQLVILAVLAALGGVALLMTQAAAMSKLPDAEVILQTLVKWNLVEMEGDRYNLNQTLVEAVQQEYDLTPWRENALEYFKSWTQQYQTAPSLLLAETDAIFQTLIWAVGVGRWAETLQIVKAVEGAFALSKQWGLWEQLLQWALQAAQAMGDKAAEAWALHQLGSRALCLEEMTTAENYLTQALQIRESLGDEVGKAVTRHNLNLLAVPPAPPPIEQTSFWLKTFLALLLIGLTGWFVWSLLYRPTPRLSLSPESLNFGRQPVKLPSQPQTVTLENSGSAVLKITRKIEITGSESNDFTISNNSCSEDSIQPQANCTVSISFGPRDVGKRNASLSITDNSADKPHLVQLTGEGFTANEAPVANPDTSQTGYFQRVTISVLDNDTDSDGDAIKISNFTQATNGTVSRADDQKSLIYQPNRGFSGEDTFTYSIQDAKGATAKATVKVTVGQQPNQPPLANPDTSQTGYFQQVTIPVLGNDTDPNGDAINISNFTQATNGTVSRTNDQKSLIYQPNRGFSGEDTFTYSIQDAKGATAKATVKVTVGQQPNQPPLANPDTSQTGYFQRVTIPVLNNDTDPNGNAINISNFTQATNGTVSRTNDQRSLIYQPNRGFSGEDTFTYTIRDANGATATATVKVMVAQQPNQAPKANPDTWQTGYFQRVTIPVLNNDTDPNGNAINISNFTQATNGTVSRANDQKSLIYQPNRGFSGEDTFTYTIRDANGATATATVKVTVAPDYPF
ncbi:tandem-95 repeat protein [Desmonostoc muscorum CCALA 125]|nr:tandem-95 repeat protein [Desmonostoc muscorum CCALA 125]